MRAPQGWLHSAFARCRKLSGSSRALLSYISPKRPRTGECCLQLWLRLSVVGTTEGLLHIPPPFPPSPPRLSTRRLPAALVKAACVALRPYSKPHAGAAPRLNVLGRAGLNQPLSTCSEVSNTGTLR